jgi:hypothetical protein
MLVSSGQISHLKYLQVLDFFWPNGLGQPAALYLWNEGMTTGHLMGIDNNGFAAHFFVWGYSSGILTITQDINLSGKYYKLSALGDQL